jgi:hypothetical protein
MKEDMLTTVNVSYTTYLKEERVREESRRERKAEKD